MPLRYVSVQPRLVYYAWQVEVMINNFLKNGVNPNYIDILVAYYPDDLTSTPQNISIWNNLAERYNTVRFFFYEDTRARPVRYISSIRPNVLKQHFEARPEIQDDVIFYHDCDIALTKPVDFSELLEDKTWYGSDVQSYIGYDYVLSKGEDVLMLMCSIVGIKPEVVKANQLNTIGAQYIIKGADYAFWDKVEKDCERMFAEVNSLNGMKKLADPRHHELQIWCADMWSVLWNAWLFGHQTKTSDKLDFCWPGDGLDRWEKCYIFHNAGVTGPGDLFYKGSYMDRFPYEDDLFVREGTCSKKYYEQIKTTDPVLKNML
jgi:hypothetical protein